MKLPTALRSSGVAAAACTACCAPPIIAALGLTAGLAATVGNEVWRSACCRCTPP
jgi:hypothetical protein